MFDALSTRLQDVFRSIRGEGRLTEANVETALREIRLALLEADVNFKVVKAFIDRVRDRAMDQEVLRSLTPGSRSSASCATRCWRCSATRKAGSRQTQKRPRVVMLLGLQGSGKTTTAGKLGRWLTRQGRHPLLVSTDVRRPAAIEQLNVLGKQAGLRVSRPGGRDGPGRARARARSREAQQPRVRRGHRRHRGPAAHRRRADGRAARRSRRPSSRSDLLYVADAMTGQDAIKSAGEFNRRVGVTGVVLTKLDGDARGGAALSVVSVVGVPIAFVGSGERLEDLEPFHPDRVVSRLLGMGDVLSLIEKAEQAIDVEDAEKLEEKLRNERRSRSRTSASSCGRSARWGRSRAILGMIPGMGNLKQLAENKPDEKQLGRVEAIIASMTPARAAATTVINGSRRKRIARGSGTSVEEVNRLLKQFVRDAQDAEAAGRDGGGGRKKRLAACCGMLAGRR